MIPLPHRVSELESQVTQLRTAMSTLRRDLEDCLALNSAEHRVFRADLSLLHSVVRQPSGVIPGTGWICAKLRFLQTAWWHLAMRVRSMLHALRGRFPASALDNINWPPPPALTEDLYLQIDDAML